MININLSQSAKEVNVARKVSHFDKNLIISSGLIFLTLLVFGGVKLYAFSLQKKISEMENMIAAKSSAVKEDDIKRVLEFSSRASKISNLDSRYYPNDTIAKIEQVLLEKTYLTSLSYDHEARTFLADAVSASLEDMAKQIVSLKSSPYFTSLDLVGSYEEDDKEKISYQLQGIMSESKFEAKPDSESGE